LEADDHLTVRDFTFDGRRDAAGGDWTARVRFHCETPDVGVAHNGVFEVVLRRAGGVVVAQRRWPVTLTGDSRREASTDVFEFDVDDALVEFYRVLSGLERVYWVNHPVNQSFCRFLMGLL